MPRPPAKIIPTTTLTAVRGALYNSKLAMEQNFDERDRASILRSIIEALDATTKLDDAP